MKLLTLLLSTAFLYAAHASGNEPLLQGDRIEDLPDARIDNEAHDVPDPEARDVPNPADELYDALERISADFQPHHGVKWTETLMASEVGWELVTHTADIFARPLDKALSVCNMNTCKKICSSAKMAKNFVKAHPRISFAAAIVAGFFLGFKHTITDGLTNFATSWIELSKPIRFLWYMLVDIFIRLPLATLIPAYASLHSAAVEVLEMNTDNPSAMWTVAYSMIAALPACAAPAALSRDQLLKIFKVIQKSPQVFWVTAASVMTIIGPDWDTLSFQEKQLRMLKGSLLAHVAPFSGAVMTAIQPLMMRNIPDLLFFGSGGLFDDYVIALAGEAKKNPSKVVVPISVLTVGAQIVKAIDHLLEYKRNGMDAQILQKLMYGLVTLFVNSYFIHRSFYITTTAEMTGLDAFYLGMSPIIGNAFAKIFVDGPFMLYNRTTSARETSPYSEYITLVA